MTISTAPTEPALDAFWASNAAEARFLRPTARTHPVGARRHARN